VWAYVYKDTIRTWSIRIPNPDVFKKFLHVFVKCLLEVNFNSRIRDKVM
jgi:hypothetical protein